jgi:hypothetical protein
VSLYAVLYSLIPTATWNLVLTTGRLGVPLAACTNYAEWMTDVGFEDVTEKRMKMPSSPWPKDKRMKLIGAFEMHNLLRGISGMSLRMFNKAYGWSQEQIEMFLVKVRQDTAYLKCKFMRSLFYILPC